MRFGTPVWVHRGGSQPRGKIGCSRWVKGTLIGARGHERLVRLEEDDPLSGFEPWRHRGAVGSWEASQIIPRTS